MRYTITSSPVSGRLVVTREWGSWLRRLYGDFSVRRQGVVEVAPGNVTRSYGYIVPGLIAIDYDRTFF